ncbi:MAG TPA: hypothetical protein VLL52_03855 [Anaerolineae bacterium]|nr:hypothetical protein [Anaerolineae bacterium]
MGREQQLPEMGRWLVVVVMMVAVGMVAWVLGWPGVITAVDINQHRLNKPLPGINRAEGYSQTFRPRRDGMYQIDLLAVRYEDVAQAELGSLFIQLTNEAGEVVAEWDVATGGIGHNEPYTLQFEPQVDSGGQQYRLQMVGNGYNPITFWGYTVDVHAGGAFEPAEGELTDLAEMRFSTTYQLLPRTAVAEIVGPVGRYGFGWLLLGLFLLGPGVAWLVWFVPGSWRWPWLVWVGMGVALGMGTWPIVWGWVTLVNGRFGPTSLWGLTIIWWLVGGAGFYWHKRKKGDDEGGVRRQKLGGVGGLLLLILVIGLMGRLVAVRDLVAPPWVDSSRHAFMTQITMDTGQMITDYEPYWEAERLPYHYGFHTIAASWFLMQGDELEPEALLYLGQLLNGLVGLMVFSGAWLLTRQKWVGLLAAFWVSIPYFFPAYYATWGRFTQLSGMMILPLLMGVTWQVGLGARQRRQGGVLLMGVLATGLFLIHMRVFIFYLPWAGLVALLAGWRRWKPLLLAGGLTVLLSGPRLWILWRWTTPSRWTRPTISNYHEFPTGYLSVGWEQWFWGLVAVVVVYVVYLAVRRPRRATLPLAVLLWVVATLVAVSGRRVGLPETNLLNLSSLYISLFWPAALLLGIGGYAWGRWLGRQRWLWQVVGYGLVGGGVAIVGWYGWQQQGMIINPQTVLAEPADVAGWAWVDENLPAEAKVGVNGWQWLGNTWAVNDGGAWVLPLTGRMVSTPPVDYIYNRGLAEEVRAFNGEAVAVADWTEPTSIRLFHEYGITHLFVGSRGGLWDPADLIENPNVWLLWGEDGAFVFAVRYE